MNTKSVVKTNRVLKSMLAKITKAKKEGLKSVTVYVTSTKDYKKNSDPFRIASEDLKPSVLEAYKHICCKNTITHCLVDFNTKSVEWIVKLK
jgi:undecaprenyl pyrophosphate synthase